MHECISCNEPCDCEEGRAHAANCIGCIDCYDESCDDDDPFDNADADDWEN